MTAFRDVYLPANRKYRILDIGSKAHDAQDSYRPLFGGPHYEYIGLDLESGPNVDIVPRSAYSWAELESCSFDAVISGQVFEHNPFFWITMAEIARVLRPDGLVCIIAPSSGPVHRYPQDCWRFYPDAAAAMFSYVGIELIESYVEASGLKGVSGMEWADMFAVGRRPLTIDMHRLAAIVELTPAAPFNSTPARQDEAIRRYEELVRLTYPRWLLHKLTVSLRRAGAIPVRVIRKRLVEWRR